MTFEPLINFAVVQVLQIKSAATGSSFIQRFGTWLEERKMAADRRENRAEREELYRQERLKEREVVAKAAINSADDKKQE